MTAPGNFLQKRSPTLRISGSLLKTPLLALALLFVFIAAAEYLVRSEPVRRRLAVPSIGCGVTNVDLKLDGLQAYTAAHESLDCLLVGSSVVHRAIDPAILQRRLEKPLHRRLSIYNFGLAQSNPEATVAMTRILCDLYQPKLVVWGFSPGEFFGIGQERGADSLLANPWVRYRLGTFSIEGLLVEHSLLYRHYLHYSLWLQYPHFRYLYQKHLENLSPLGYAPQERTHKYQDLTPDQLKNMLHRRFTRRFKKFHGLQDLRDMTGLAGRVKLVVLEMPFSPLVFEHFPQYRQDCEDLRHRIRRELERSGVLFIPAPEEAVVPLDGWFDINHLNRKGARRYSRWLADQLALILKDDVVVPSMAEDRPEGTPSLTGPIEE
ncbi:MAG: hypothetical protein JXQ27_03670 [Acidobacteria bacterium]|nr:hypothetical protein [Acidobacteriota bacterium]